MSRSRKKVNRGGIAAAQSEKLEKRAANRSIRRINKIEVNTGREVLTQKRANSNVWGFSKDGKRYYTDPRLMRK